LAVKFPNLFLDMFMISNVLSAATIGAMFLLVGCATNREFDVGIPTVTTFVLPKFPGETRVDGDDYYVQLVSELIFNNKTEGSDRSECREIGSSYAKGGSKIALMFQVHNDQINFDREFPGFVYETSAGRCAFNLSAKKVYLTPWMRLDTAKLIQLDYSFLRSDTGELDMARIGSDVNVASDVLAASGVGVGAAVIGKVASGWMTKQGKEGQDSKAGSTVKHQESRSLPRPVKLTETDANVDNIRFPVLALADNKISPLSSKPAVLGDVVISADVKPSILLRSTSNGVPDARDLSLEELLRTNIQSGAAAIPLEQLIFQGGHFDKPNLQPDFGNYQELELNCRKFKVVLKDLGFNKFDRNAVLYYYLEKSPDWRTYNAGGRALSGDSPRLKQLQQYQQRNFGACLSTDDYDVMKRMGLPVNSQDDWNSRLNQIQESEGYLGAIQSIERQLAPILRNSNVGEVEHQIFPLIASGKVPGSVLLQNHLGNFGLEQLLDTPSVPGEGVTVTSHQLAQVFSALRVTDFSCARPVVEQGKLIRNVAIMLFFVAPESPLGKGAALEFQFDGGKVTRLTLQSLALRDFKQEIQDHPIVGDCKIDPAWLEKVSP
jgi:hypothetical protein